MENNTLGARLKAQREAVGKTLQDIALAVGVNKCTIQRYESNAIKTPKQPVVAAIAAALGVSTEWLLGQSDKKETAPAMPPKLADAAPAELAFTYALYEEAGELTPENREKLLEMARFFKQQQDKQP